ncbi:putative modulator of DNA gyrase [Enhygromyxa salina]|uniref:Putative modulator of DNA gyrase n=1 Tax=Enhygromyxa salina TaxID=215803 RepID=A0A2S9XG87_9BACT|nr:metallopeptidase TldD-related protein [Enhygromyxa salina]PRP91888.1 putative modulator of DNA gyrase [Enhygromyxa salina]
MIGRRGFLGLGLGLGALVGELVPLREALAGPGPDADAASSELAAMEAELIRGVAELRLPDAATPYAAELRVVRADSLVLDGSYGGVIADMFTREALGTVTVRVGSHERDNGNFFGPSSVQPSFQLGFDPDPIAARKRLWLAMDQSYRAACAGYKAKLSAIDRLADKELPDDRAKLGEPVVELDWAPGATTLVDPDSARASFDRAGLRELAGELSGRFAAHPTIDNGDVIIQLMRSHEASVSSEGAAVGRSLARAVLGVIAQTQADDGMELDHGLALHLQALPEAKELRERGVALVDQVLRELEEFVAAPMLDEDYDGPILLGPTAAAQLIASTIPVQAGGDPAPMSDYGRLLEYEPHWQERLGKAVMPETIDLVDDPLAAGFGHYTRDDQGVAAQRVELVQGGILHTLLMTRRPNEHIDQSNGHARATPGGFLGATISNLTLSSRKPGLSQAALERALLERAREDGYEFAYVIDSLRDGSVLGPVPRDSAALFTSGRKISLPLPSRVFKLERKGKDTARTLVRGALLAPTSMRVFRRIRAVGERAETLPLRLSPGMAGGFGADLGLSGVLGQSVDAQVTTPALLVDGLELVVERGENERLPILDHPLRREPSA